MTLTWRAVGAALLCAALCSASSPPSSRALALAGAEDGAAAAAAGDYAGTEYRLPVTLVPSAYTVDLVVDAALDKFTGTVAIKTVALRAATFVTLHMDPAWLTATSITFESKTANEKFGPNRDIDLAKEVVLDKKLQTVTIYPMSGTAPNLANYTLVLGEKYTLTIKYNGVLRGDMYGFYKSTYTSSTGDVKLAATQFEPAYARSAFPCWDEPHFKATFEITITHNSKLTALSNTMEASSTPDTTGATKTTVFATTPPMSSYLVAFVVSDFEYKEGEFPPAAGASTTPTPTTTPSSAATTTPSSAPAPAPTSAPAPAANSITYRVYVRPESVNQAVEAAKLGPLSLQKLEEFTGITFKGGSGLSKLDLIAIPDFSAGAMENWGLITFRETGIMFDDAESTEASRESIALVIAHEQTHMWFGDLVSPEWWGYVWLNEGFARYLQYVSMDLVRPEWRLMHTFAVRTLQGALSFDALATSHPMSATVYTPDQIQGIFDRISYDKGASVLHMIRGVLGDNNFKAALNSYLTKMRFYAAKPSDLFQEFDATASKAVFPLPNGVSVAEVLSGWTEEPGYPVVTISTLSNGTVVASQARFMSSGASSSSQRWWVPLTVTTNSSGSATSKVWLSPSDNVTALPGVTPAANDWIIGNVDQNGFYRVNYDEANWRALAAHLQRTVAGVSVLNRAQLLDDAMSLARAGRLRYALALDAALYLRLETDPIPWTAAFGHLSFITRMLANNEAQAKFKSLQLELLDAVSKDVGFEEKEEGKDRDKNHLRLTFRATLMGQACGLGQEDCVGNATKAFKALRDSGAAVPPSVRSTVYCTGLRNGTTSDWDFLWKRYGDTASPGERSLILGALGCTRDEGKLNEYLANSLNGKVRAQDASAVFSSVLGGGDNLELAFKFFKDNFKSMVESYGGWSSIQNVVEGLASRIVDEAKLKELEDFLTANKDGLGVAQAAAVRSLETARTNIKWRSAHLAEVADWVAARGGGGGSGAAAVLGAPLLLATMLALLAA
ncbi:aminopeptidase N-like [Frankliniella occidentalis]|uniref:Aminopeptidase N n=1 Tax=Frankliniella occidentalis TaxID=133901 RepID=A0A6J1SYI6_FRAOC|nr:aminopeptidase N-like [Frankliniella occidentalis]